jgi:hypothetical protein
LPAIVVGETARDDDRRRNDGGTGRWLKGAKEAKEAKKGKEGENAKGL